MRGLAKIARDLGDGDIRLTVWQNLLISGVPDDKVALAEAAIDGARARRPRRPPIRAGLVACTGATGCRFAAAHTKEQRRGDRRVVRGARRARHAGQHPSHRLPSFLRAALHRRHRPDRARASPINEEGDTVDGYHILVGGGFGPDATLARDIYQDVKAEDAPRTVERMLKAYLRASRRTTRPSSPSRRRHEIDALQGDVRRGGGRMSQTVAAADPLARSRDRAVLARAARLAERLLRRPRVARRRGRHRAVARAERRADAGRRERVRRQRRRRGALARPDACRWPSA